MTELQIIGWRYGLQKVEMTKLLRAELALGLKEAKEITDQVLENKTVSLPLLDDALAHKLSLQLEQLGAITKIISSEQITK